MAKVLIVEDDKILRDVYKMIVEHAGHTVEVAADGNEGLSQLSSFSPNVVLLDMLMPNKSGIELLEDANMKKNYPKVTVIILSNLSESATIAKALKLGAVEHLIKSNVLPSQVIDTIEKYLK